MSTTDPLQHALLQQLFERQVKNDPGAVAVVCSDQQLTYAELNARANQVARALRARGVQPDARVCLYAERSVEMLVGLLGILKAGGAYVPLDVSYPTARLAYMLRDSAPVAVLTQQRLKGKLPFDDERVMTLDSDRGTIDGECDDNLDAVALGLRPRHLAYVIYTSGSTGNPKGVMIEHRNVVNLVRWHCAEFGVSKGCLCSCVAAVGFDAAAWEMWPPLSVGATLVLASPEASRDPEALLAWWADQPIDVGFLPTPIAELAFSRNIRNARLRTLLVGGDRLRHRPLSQSFVLINNYGPTEATVVTTSGCIRDEDPVLHIGRPIANSQIYIFDVHCRPVLSGVTGEIYIGGAGVARGYLNRPELTAERFLPDTYSREPQARMYRSGDFGRWRSDGTIEFLGRVDDQVKIRGCRIELGEIETHLLQHGQVREAVVLAQEGESGEKRLVSYVVPDLAKLKALQQVLPDNASAEIIRNWKKLYEDVYSRGSLGPSFVGWNSSYSGRAIPEDEMQEWLKNTVERVSALRARRVLEIGCGVGLLLERLAPSCNVYRGTDLSEEGLERLRTWLSTQGHLQHVQLEWGAALELEESRPAIYDTVIVNSVIQYFPDMEYLRAVLKRAVTWVCDGGRIFVGDVRHLGLLHVFHSSVQLESAAAGVTVGQLRGRVALAIEREKELVVDPRFFAELPNEIPSIGRVHVLLKRGQFNNELTRYRYDVILEVGSQHTAAEPDGVDWIPGNNSIAHLRAALETNPSSLSMRNIPNRRLSHDLAVSRIIDDTEESCTADKLQDLLSEMEMAGEDPETFWKLGENYGYEVRTSWTLGCDDGRFDVQLIDRKRAIDCVTAQNPGHPQSTQTTRGPGELYTNDPSGRRMQQMLAPILRDYLKKMLPPYMVPKSFVMLDSLPMTQNGKLDRRALAVRDILAYSCRDYDPPQGVMEETLAQIWQELLGVERIGRHDNFFELGGHSLLMVEMMGRLQRMGLAAEARNIYSSPTLADLARTLTTETMLPFESPPNLISPHGGEITPQMLPLVSLEPEQIERIVRDIPGGAENVQDIYPLTPLQEGMLFHHLLDKERGDTYVLLTLLSLSSRQQLEKWLAALQAVIDRHDALRTAILWEQLPQPVQVVCRRAFLTVEELMLDSDGDPIAQFKERMKPELQRLDLRQAPLIRIQVAADNKCARWYVLLKMHHIICDQQSLDIMLEEVSTYSEGNSNALPQAGLFRNHVARSLAYSRTSEMREFFLNKLRGIDEPIVSFGLSDAQADGSRIEEARGSLEPALERSIRDQARRMGVSAATLWHVAWALVVSATSGRDDVVFGSVLLGRLQVSEGRQRVLGPFINTLPLRLRLLGLDVKTLVEQTQRELAELLHHEHASLAVAQRCSGVIGSAPLFNTVFNYMHGAPNSTVTAGQGWTNYPITLLVHDLGQEFALLVQTDRRIDPRRVLAYVRTALQSLVHALERTPQALALALSILPQRERYQVTDLFNATQRDYPHDHCIHELFEEQVRRAPDAVAVVYEGALLTYGELNAKANKLARYLREIGIGPDQLVGVCVERGLEMMVGLLGILKAGGAYVPLDPAYPAERLAYMLEDAAPTVVLTQERLREGLPATASRVIALDSAWNEIAHQSSDNVDVKSIGLHADHLAYVIYTSGSTGRPKGVLLEHHGLCNVATLQQHVFATRTDSRVLQFASFSFDACTWEWVMALCAGARLCAASRADLIPGERLQATLDTLGITHATLPPIVLGALLPEAGSETLRTLIVAGEACPGTLVQQWAHGRQFVNAYGPTETTICASMQSCDLHEGENPPIGRPVANSRIYILDDHCEPVPIGLTGEIYIGGDGVGRGYLRQPKLTAERFMADPFATDPPARMYKTGDLGRWREDGSIEFQGRNDHQVKIRGFRIELGEIEIQLQRHAQVKEAVVIAREDVPGEKRLVAYVVIQLSNDPTESIFRQQLIPQLQEYLRHRLPDYMIPLGWLVLDELPLTPNGKLDRRALPVPQSRPNEAAGYVAPRTELEHMLSQLLARLLGVAKVGVHDNFFELGGHSLLATRVVTHISHLLDVQIPLRAIFEEPTIEALSSRIIAAIASDL